MDFDTCSVCFSPLFSNNALYCSDSCRRSDAASTSSPVVSVRLSSPTKQQAPSSSSNARRPQLTITMPRSFAQCSSTQQSRSAIIPSYSTLLPTPEQLASRTRRNTAPSSSRTEHLASIAKKSASSLAPPAFPSRRLVPQSYRSQSNTYASPEDLARDMAQLPESSPSSSQSSTSPLRRPTIVTSGSRLVELTVDDETPLRQASSAPNPQQQQQSQPRYTGKDRSGLLDWVAQVKLHTPSPPSPSRRQSSSSSYPPISPVLSSSSLANRFKISKPSPAPPIITTPSFSSTPCPFKASATTSTYPTSKLVVDVMDRDEDVEEAATLVHPPSSSALDTLSMASFHQFLVADEVRGVSGCVQEEDEEESDESVSTQEKTLSPPLVSTRVERTEKTMATTTRERKKGTFTLKPAYRPVESDCTDSDSESESEYSADEESQSEGAISRTSSFACCSAASMAPSSPAPFLSKPKATVRRASNPCVEQENKSQVYSLEDLLALGPSQSRSKSQSRSLVAVESHFSSESESDSDEESVISEEGEMSLYEAEEGVEGERDCDLWQMRGRSSRPLQVVSAN